MKSKIRYLEIVLSNNDVLEFPYKPPYGWDMTYSATAYCNSHVGHYTQYYTCKLWK